MQKSRADQLAQVARFCAFGAVALLIAGAIALAMLPSPMIGGLLLLVAVIDGVLALLLTKLSPSR
jgi:hypothetical protein